MDCQWPLDACDSRETQGGWVFLGPTSEQCCVSGQSLRGGEVSEGLDLGLELRWAETQLPATPMLPPLGREITFPHFNQGRLAEHKAESTSRTESETGRNPQYKTPLPRRWLHTEAGP